MSAGSKLKFLLSSRTSLIRCQMAEFLSLKKNQQVCVLQSCCEMNLLSANSAVECWWTYSDDTVDLCLLTVLCGDEKKVDSCFLLLYFFFCYWCRNALCWKIICILKTPRSVSTGRELPFCTNIPSVEACSLCTNSVFSPEVLLRNCKGLRSTCMCSALVVWNKACSFPLLHLPVQMKGSMPRGCSGKGKLMFIQWFTLPQKPHLTSEKSLFPPPAPLPRVHSGNV